MDQTRYVSPEEGSVKPPGGPEDQPGYSRVALRTQGLLSLAFGVALGLTLIVLHWLFSWTVFPEKVQGLLPVLVEHSVLRTLGYYFLIGFVAGTFTAALYNMLVVKRINMFGLESSQN